MDKQKLHFQADRIEMLLATHHAPARVTGGRVTPRTIQFHLAPAPTTRVSKVEALSEEIALSLGTPSARVTRSNGTLAVEIPRADSHLVNLLSLNAKLRADAQLDRVLSTPGTALLGLDAEGVPLLLRLSSPEVAHCLVAGTTGSGKTELARALVASLMLNQKPREVQLILMDPKGRSFDLFEGLPHLLFPVAREIETMLDRFAWLVNEMERRDRDGITLPRVVVVLDELADMLNVGGKELEHHLARLVQRGRSAGISVIACTQKPTVALVGSLVKANFPVRLVGRVTSAEEARVAAGIGGTGAEKLAGRGDFVVVAGGCVLRLQSAYLPVAEYARFRAEVSNHREMLAATGTEGRRVTPPTYLRRVK
jgi:S-DNA-T family DNA segregation ATPase FtsK/SpoIIIE